MTRRRTIIDQIKVTKPCPADWYAMPGSDRMRYCAECEKYVYNISAMTPVEAELLVARTGGELCVRLTQKSDYTPILNDVSAVLPSVSRRPSVVAGAVVSALISLSPPSMGHSLSATVAPLSSVISARRDAEPRTDSGAARRLTGRVSLERRPSVLERLGLRRVESEPEPPKPVNVLLINEYTGEERQATLGPDGEYEFKIDTSDPFILQISSEGYSTSTTTGIVIQVGGVRHIETKLLDEVGIGGAASSVISPHVRQTILESALIVVARAASTENVEHPSDKDREITRTVLNVSSTLKGEHRGRIEIYTEDDGDHRITANADHLIFLRRVQEIDGFKVDDGYAPTVWQRGPLADLKILEARVNELLKLGEAARRIGPEVVEWLVRCVEEPVTRWGAAAELLSHFDKAEADDSDEADDEDQADDEDDYSEDPVRATQPKPGVNETRDATVESLLTNAQKERLIHALLKTTELGDAELRLMHLVRKLNDPRLLSFLVSYLHRVELNPPRDTNEILAVVSDMMQDKVVTILSRIYATEARYTDLDAEERSLDEGESGEEAEAEESTEPESEAVTETISKMDSAPEVRASRVLMLRRLLEIIERRLNRPAAPSRP